MVSQEKILLRSEYRRIRKNYMQMIRRDFEKYLVPKDVVNYIPNIPRIVSDDVLFKNATAGRLRGSINKLERYINSYKRYRNTWEKLDDAILRKYESMLTDYITDFDPPRKTRAQNIMNSLKNRISSSKRERYFVSRRIEKRYEELRKDTNRYVYYYGKKDGDDASIILRELFAIVIRDIFKPANDEDKFFHRIWSEIENDLAEISGDTGVDDVYNEVFEV